MPNNEKLIRRQRLLEVLSEVNRTMISAGDHIQTAVNAGQVERAKAYGVMMKLYATQQADLYRQIDALADALDQERPGWEDSVPVVPPIRNLET